MQRTVAHLPSAAPGDVVEAVESTESFKSVTNGVYGRLRARGICSKCERVLPKLTLGSLNVRGIASDNSYARASRDKGTSCRNADAGGSANDHDGFFGKRRHG